MAPAPQPQQEPELTEAAASKVVDAAVLEKLRAERAKARQHARTILDDDVIDEGEANGR